MLCSARRGTSSLLFQWAFNWLQARNMEETEDKGLGSTTECYTSLHDSALKWWDGWEANRLPFNERSHSCSLLSSNSQAVPPPHPHLFFLISASLGGGDCSRWSTQALSPANCLRFRRFRSALLIKAGQRQLGNINMMKALTKSLFKLRRNESWWAPLVRDQRVCLWISWNAFAVKLHLQLNACMHLYKCFFFVNI